MANRKQKIQEIFPRYDFTLITKNKLINSQERFNAVWFDVLCRRKIRTQLFELKAVFV